MIWSDALYIVFLFSIVMFSLTNVFEVATVPSYVAIGYTQ